MSVYFVTLFSVIGYINGIPLESPSDSLSGYFDPYIWGGEDVPEGFAPYKAALVIGAPFQSLMCGGSIISKKHIATAAQCIAPLIDYEEILSSYHAVVGSNKWRSGGYAMKFKGHHIHPEWDNINIKNDIGVLITEDELVFSKTVGLIGPSFDWVGGDVEAFVAGFGISNEWHIPEYLQVLYVTTLSEQKCVDKVHNMIGNISPGVQPKFEICTNQPIGEGMCMGDVGNGLVSLDNKLIGIASWGFACAFGVPDIFARMSSFKNFMDTIKYT